MQLMIALFTFLCMFFFFYVLTNCMLKGNCEYDLLFCFWFTFLLNKCNDDECLNLLLFCRFNHMALWLFCFVSLTRISIFCPFLPLNFKFSFVFFSASTTWVSRFLFVRLRFTLVFLSSSSL